MNTVIELSAAVPVGSRSYERTATINGISRMAQGSTPIVAAIEAVRSVLNASESRNSVTPPAPTPPPPVQQAAPVAAPPAVPATPAQPEIQRDANGYRVDPNDPKARLVGKRVTSTGGFTRNRQGLVKGLGDKLSYVLVLWDGDSKDTAEKPMFLRVVG
jgi:hypothetical protein